MKIVRCMSGLAMAAFMMLAGSCGSASANTDSTSSNDNKNNNDMNTTQMTDSNFVKLRFETSEGNFTVLLYGDTPAHRDNMVKLAKDGFYDGTLFHRVIKEFMVQAGDPESKGAAPGQRLGAGGPGYTLPAEIVFPRHFHKRGALAAARQGDQVNPERRSSGSQFYVVTGNKFTAEQLNQIEERMNGSLMEAEFYKLASQHQDEIRTMQMNGDRAGLEALQNRLIEEAREAVKGKGMSLTPEMREAYMSVGGAPHLDGQYTVFGEVVDGMDVIDKIEKAETDSSDRPKQDIVINKVVVL